MPSVSLRDIVKDRLGANTSARINPETATVGATSQVILRQDANRIAATIINLSANDVYVAVNGPASTTRGIYLAPAGGGMVLDYQRDHDTVGYEWQAIASGAGSAIHVIETRLLRNPDDKG